MLTTTEHRNFQKYIARWLEFGAPRNERLVERLRPTVDEIYNQMVLPPPQIILCPGPMHQALMPALVALMAQLGHEESAATTFAPGVHEDSDVRAVWKGVWKDTFDAIDWHNDRAIGAGFTVNAKIMRSLERVLLPRLTAAVDEHVGMDHGEEFEKLIKSQLERPYEQLRARIMFNQLDSSNLWKSFMRRLPENFATELTRTLDAFEKGPRDASKGVLPFGANGPLPEHWIGGWDWLGIATGDFAREFLKGKLSDGVSKLLDLWIELQSNATAYLFCEHCCFVYVKPLELFFDEEWRPHHPSKAAMHFVDETKMFYWHGVEVPENIITNPKKIKIKDIERQPNIEIRRVMIDRYGLGTYLIACGARKIHEDKYGILYRTEQGLDETLVVVKVVNSTPEPDGTYKEYFLRVPPEMETAREAVAWTFGMTADEYAPAEET